MSNSSSDCNIPSHVAIIMDGNGRWAESRGLERMYGHIHGVESVRKVLRAAAKHGVEYLTVYAFSTENWGRPAHEVNKLMELLCKSTLDETPALNKEGVRLRFIGDIETLSYDVRESIRLSEEATFANKKITLVVAINYSSRWEIAHAISKIASKVAAGELSPELITQEMVSENLTTKDIPDPDFLIRTSGELRLSNFMLWQLSYSELYFTDIYWPDFGEQEFNEALTEYAKRKRRYGLLK